MTRRDVIFLGAIAFIRFCFLVGFLGVLTYLNSLPQEANVHQPPSGTLIDSYCAPAKGDHVDVYQDANMVYIDIYSEKRKMQPRVETFQCSQKLTSEHLSFSWQKHGIVHNPDFPIDAAALVIYEDTAQKGDTIYRLFISFTDPQDTYSY